MYILNAIRHITQAYNFSNRKKHNSRYVLETLSNMAATKEQRLLDFLEKYCQVNGFTIHINQVNTTHIRFCVKIGAKILTFRDVEYIYW